MCRCSVITARDPVAEANEDLNPDDTGNPFPPLRDAMTINVPSYSPFFHCGACQDYYRELGGEA